MRWLARGVWWVAGGQVSGSSWQAAGGRRTWASHALYNGHPEGEPGGELVKVEHPETEELPWQKLARFYPRRDGLIPMLQKQHHWAARAFETNLARSAQLAQHPLTRKHFDFWSLAHPKPKAE